MPLYHPKVTFYDNLFSVRSKISYLAEFSSFNQTCSKIYYQHAETSCCAGLRAWDACRRSGEFIFQTWQAIFWEYFCRGSFWILKKKYKSFLGNFSRLSK